MITFEVLCILLTYVSSKSNDRINYYQTKLSIDHAAQKMIIRCNKDIEIHIFVTTDIDAREIEVKDK